MSWNYRIVRYRDNQGFGLHEVYYNSKGEPTARTADPISFASDDEEGPEGIIRSIEAALLDARNRPILDDLEDGEWATWDGEGDQDDEDE